MPATMSRRRANGFAVKMVVEHPKGYGGSESWMKAGQFPVLPATNQAGSEEVMAFQSPQEAQSAVSKLPKKPHTSYKIVPLGGAKNKAASRSAGLGGLFVSFMNNVLKKPQGQMQNKVNRLRQKYGENWDEIGKDILIEIGGELNMLAQKNNSTDAAKNMVAEKYGMDPKMVQGLWYAVGAPFQDSGAQFDMLKIKESKAAGLRTLLQDLQSKDVDWDAAKPELLQAINGLKINPKDKRTLQMGIQGASNYEKAESALVYMEMKHQGMPADILQKSDPTSSRGASRRVPMVVVAYTIPWVQKDAVRKAQLAFRRSAGIRLATSPKGLLVVADHHALAATGMTFRSPPKFPRFARSTGQVLSSTFHQHMSGIVTADIHVAMSAPLARRYAAHLIQNGGVHSAVIWDVSGTPHLASRDSSRFAATKKPNELKKGDRIEDPEQGNQWLTVTKVNYGGPVSGYDIHTDKGKRNVSPDEEIQCEG